MDSSQYTEVIKQKTKFNNLRNDVVDFNKGQQDALKYQETTIHENGDLKNVKNYSELYDLTKGYTICTRDTTDCFAKEFLGIDPNETY